MGKHQTGPVEDPGDFQALEDTLPGQLNTRVRGYGGKVEDVKLKPTEDYLMMVTSWQHNWNLAKAEHNSEFEEGEWKTGEEPEEDQQTGQKRKRRCIEKTAKSQEDLGGGRRIQPEDKLADEAN